MTLKNTIENTTRNFWKYATLTLAGIILVLNIVFFKMRNSEGDQGRTDTSANSSQSIEEEKLKSLQSIEKNLKEMRNAQKEKDDREAQEQWNQFVNNMGKSTDDLVRSWRQADEKEKRVKQEEKKYKESLKNLQNSISQNTNQ